MVTGNSLTGSNTSDAVSGGGITALTNGNYVVDSPDWTNGANANAGAVTWNSGATGKTINNLFEVVSTTNSLFSSVANKHVGSGGVVALTNNHFAMASQFWNGNRGAVVWGSGTVGLVGDIAVAAKASGAAAGDFFGNGGVKVLANGNYVVSSPNWNSNRGAITWGNGTTGTTATVGAANSLLGASAGDLIGNTGTTVLTNNNFVVASPNFNDMVNGHPNAGAITWVSGSGPTTGTVGSGNSQVGFFANDFAGFDAGVTALTNGNYVVASNSWNGTRGAVTWGNGTSGTNGFITTSNSITGSNAGNQVGSGGVLALSDGNYVVLSPLWSFSSSFAQDGAATWASGSGVSAFTVALANSLVGALGADKIGSIAVAVSGGNYVVGSSSARNVTLAAAGVLTWVNGATARPVDGQNVDTLANSVFGQTAGAGLDTVVFDPVNNTFLSAFVTEAGGTVRVGLLSSSQLTYSRGRGGNIEVVPAFLTQTLCSRLLLSQSMARKKLSPVRRVWTGT